MTKWKKKRYWFKSRKWIWRTKSVKGIREVWWCRWFVFLSLFFVFLETTNWFSCNEHEWLFGRFLRWICSDVRYVVCTILLFPVLTSLHILISYAQFSISLDLFLSLPLSVTIAQRTHLIWICKYLKLKEIQYGWTSAYSSANVWFPLLLSIIFSTHYIYNILVVVVVDLVASTKSSDR